MFSSSVASVENEVRVSIASLAELSSSLDSTSNTLMPECDSTGTEATGSTSEVELPLMASSGPACHYEDDPCGVLVPSAFSRIARSPERIRLPVEFAKGPLPLPVAIS